MGVVKYDSRKRTEYTKIQRYPEKWLFKIQKKHDMEVFDRFSTKIVSQIEAIFDQYARLHVLCLPKELSVGLNFIKKGRVTYQNYGRIYLAHLD